MNQDLVVQKNKLKKKLEECEIYAKDLKTKNENLKSEIQIMKNIQEKRFVKIILVGWNTDQSEKSLIFKLW